MGPLFAAFRHRDMVRRMTKLVIVDDHEAMREGLAALLQGEGMEILGAAGNVAAGLALVGHAPTGRRGAAGNVAAALDLGEQAAPDVAIVDIQLPDGSGTELTRALLARLPDLGVI